MAVTAIGSSTSSTTALEPGDREAVILCNSDANAAYVLFEIGTASAANCSVVLAQNEAIQVPQEYVNGGFSVIWAADGTGSLHITTR